MALLRRLISSSPPLSTTCLSPEPPQPIPFNKTFSSCPPHKFHSLSLSLSTSFVSPLLQPRRGSHFETRFSSATESPPASPDTEEVQSKDRLYAQNVPWDCTPEDIRALFGKYGTVRDVELSMYDKTRNRGLAFITMGSPEEALQALNNLQSYELNGRVIKLDYARARTKKITPPPEPKPEITFNLFVANLAYDARAKDVRDFFTAEGHNAVSAEVIFHDRPRRSLGYGFVAFKSKKEAEAAMAALSGKLCMGRPIRLARSKQFVKPPKPESVESEEISTELDSSESQSEVVEGN